MASFLVVDGLFVDGLVIEKLLVINIGRVVDVDTDTVPALLVT